MGVYWEWPDIVMAVVGGSLIALSSILNLYLMGRITGLSGMVFTVTRFKLSEGAIWKLSFLIGMLSMCYFMFIVAGESLAFGSYDYYIFDPNSVGVKDLSIIGWIVGAFLVGLGTKLGNGCTSGHGVCGLPRLSIRSFAAVGIFMATAVALATFRYYVPFFDNESDFGDGYYDVFRIIASVLICLLVVLFMVVAIYSYVKKAGLNRYDPMISFGTGLVFGLGLCLSGMCRRSKIIGFLTLKDGWDPSLMFVMGAAVCINAPVFWYVLKKTSCPLLADKYGVPTKKTIDWQILVGPAFFGLGWGLCGFCPGPGLVNVFILDQAVLFLVFLIIGQLLAYWITTRLEKKVEKPVENGKRNSTTKLNPS